MEPRMDYWKAAPQGLAGFARPEHLCRGLRPGASALGTGEDPGFPDQWLRTLPRHAHQEARAAGETEQRLLHPICWREAPFFNDRDGRRWPGPKS